jgi:hypothetical protein
MILSVVSSGDGLLQGSASIIKAQSKKPKVKENLSTIILNNFPERSYQTW